MPKNPQSDAKAFKQAISNNDFASLGKIIKPYKDENEKTPLVDAIIPLIETGSVFTEEKQAYAIRHIYEHSSDEQKKSLRNLVRSMQSEDNKNIAKKFFTEEDKNLLNSLEAPQKEQQLEAPKKVVSVEEAIYTAKSVEEFKQILGINADDENLHKVVEKALKARDYVTGGKPCTEEHKKQLMETPGWLDLLDHLAKCVIAFVTRQEEVQSTYQAKNDFQSLIKRKKEQTAKGDQLPPK